MGRSSLEKKLYNSWRGAKGRCTQVNHKNYHLYKGRWHEPWSSFEVFKEWALSSGYRKSLTIDRINAKLGYAQQLIASANSAGAGLYIVASVTTLMVLVVLILHRRKASS